MFVIKRWSSYNHVSLGKFITFERIRLLFDFRSSLWTDSSCENSSLIEKGFDEDEKHVLTLDSDFYRSGIYGKLPS
ncbi:hypothetical protein LEP1GSC040_1356 [Leptospira santarosai str. 2000030832]|nr:hypothetical protein LEP1GSC040_1356 [Leptospira santarosai str. 2000030832]